MSVHKFIVALLGLRDQTSTLILVDVDLTGLIEICNTRIILYRRVQASTFVYSSLHLLYKGGVGTRSMPPVVGSTVENSDRCRYGAI